MINAYISIALMVLFYSVYTMEDEPPLQVEQLICERYDLDLKHTSEEIYKKALHREQSGRVKFIIVCG